MADKPERNRGPTLIRDIIPDVLQGILAAVAIQRTKTKAQREARRWFHNPAPKNSRPN